MDLPFGISEKIGPGEGASSLAQDKDSTHGDLKRLNSPLNMNAGDIDGAAGRGFLAQEHATYVLRKKM